MERAVSAPSSLQTMLVNQNGANSPSDDDSSDSDEKVSTSGRVERQPGIGVVQKLSPGEVRWMYRLPKSKGWKPMDGWDSLLVELKYRVKLGQRTGYPNDDPFMENVKVMKLCVMEDLYRVDFEKMEAIAIYSPHETIPLHRGTWFVGSKFQPLDATDSENVEWEHLTKFMGKPLPRPTEQEPDKSMQPEHVKALRGRKVVWYDSQRIYLVETKRRFPLIRAKNRSGIRLYRGYHTSCSHETEKPIVQHVVLLIHGIGAKQNVRKIYDNASKMRQCFSRVKDRALGSNSPHVMFLPVEWRNDLNLCDEKIDSITPRLLAGMRSFLNRTCVDVLYYQSPLYQREITNGVITGCNQVHRTFLKYHPSFHQDGGQISVVAHSLGGVIMYDILSNWCPLKDYNNFISNRITERLSGRANLVRDHENCGNLLPDTTANKCHHLIVKEGITELLQADQLRLNFTVSRLFVLGSPLGIFLALRNFQGGSLGQGTGRLQRLYNIYYASDPVAYRLEPLIESSLSRVEPVYIPKWDFNLRKQSEVTRQNEDRSESTSGRSRQKGLRRFLSRSSISGSVAQNPGFTGSTDIPHESDAEGIVIADASTGYQNKVSLLRSSLPALERVSQPCEAEQNSIGGVLLACKGALISTRSPRSTKCSLPQQRIDYVLQARRNTYLAAISSHFAYWDSNDLLRFIVQELELEEIDSNVES